MGLRLWDFLRLLVLQLLVGIYVQAADIAQQPLGHHDQPRSTPKSISTPLFADLERLARLVDISYCVGTSGVRKPFKCLSRCGEFPNLSLVTTWSTGILLSDSCGYVAVDHGESQDAVEGDDTEQGDKQGAIIVAFRGTYSITNTIIDLSSVPQKYVPYPSPGSGEEGSLEESEKKCANCTVHMGFLDSWKNARRVVLPELEAIKAQYPSYPIHLVGHSLGGSVACLAALEMKVSLGWDDLVVTTFGEPRVGNQQLAQYVDKVFDLDGDQDLEHRSYRRVTHKNDPVPLLPLSEWGYRAHGGEIYISKQDLSPAEEDLVECVGDTDPSCIDDADSSLRTFMRSLIPFQSDGKAPDKSVDAKGFPTRFKLWQLFFAHRDYFWRLGLCVPGGDPFDWGRHKYGGTEPDEL